MDIFLWNQHLQRAETGWSANANGREYFILLRCFGEFCQDTKFEVVQFWVTLWITELEQQIEVRG